MLYTLVKFSHFHLLIFCCRQRPNSHTHSLSLSVSLSIIISFTTGRPFAIAHMHSTRAQPSQRLSVLVAASAATTEDPAAPQFGKGAARRVVITGMGVVSSLGHNPTEFYDNLLAGKSGISLIENFDTSTLIKKVFFFFLNSF